ncbi:MAG: hypothetical protein EA360_11395 [Balneolaceae bacterium]|nr:MAG: hypothetical protein EA360_11395 [Balneolaceae bacterium]
MRFTDLGKNHLDKVVKKRPPFFNGTMEKKKGGHDIAWPGRAFSSAGKDQKVNIRPLRLI